LEGIEEQLPVDQNKEDLETPHKQKVGKIHKRTRQLKKENKLLKRKVEKVEALKLKVGKLRRFIKELRK
jgi:DNA-binding transcriptional regulator GbsR (MarR family)